VIDKSNFTTLVGETIFTFGNYIFKNDYFMLIKFLKIKEECVI